MYCGQCGKKIMENMLFCPFCGSPVVIPDQDAAVPAPQNVQEPLPPQEPLQPLQMDDVPEEQEGPVSLFDHYDEKEPAAQPEPEPERFIPLSFMLEDEEEEEEVPVPEIQPAADLHPDVAEELTRKPAHRPAAETRRPENAQRRAVNTYIPVKDIDPDDMFMDGYDDEEDDYDDYDDDYDAPAAPVRERYRDDDFDFEEPERGGFFHRHIRGIVGLMLFLLLAVICAVWVFSANGQLALAKMNLAWTAKPYAELGYEAYQSNSDLMAARHYEKALSIDGSNYEYAHSAMVAYYEANEIESAAAMLKKCVEMDPDNSEPYLEMLILYPEAEGRPWEISELIRQGYRRTGHEALNIGE